MTHNITHVEAHWPAADRPAVSITHTYPPRPLGWEDLIVALPRILPHALLTAGVVGLLCVVFAVLV